MTKVFISYSHDSDAHKQRVLELSNNLRGDGIDCWIDQYEPVPPEGWPRKMDRGIREADFVLIVCTETYLRRLQLEEEEGKGLGVAWEGSLIYNTLYRDRTLNNKFVPVLFKSENEQSVPTILFGNSRYDLSLPRGYNHLYSHLRGELGAKMPELGRPRFVRTIHSDDLPTVEGELFGRKGELALLDTAIADSKIHIVQFVASGGTGKTKLIRHWLDENNDKIEALIAWSFYSQGSSEDKQISATPFFMQALKSLGSDKSVSDFNTEEEKGEYVANLLREKRCLLVLDGLEPLQQVGRGMRGELKDRAIRKLLRCLVGDHSSLCIITTRLPVHELKGRRQVVQHDLQNLAPEDGVKLLRSFGVSGRDVDMLAAVEEYGRHALALHLLGNALATYLDGDVRKRDTLTELIGDYDEMERHAFKVMQAYEHWLAGTPELKLLYLLGLFDHPVEQEVLEVLWEAEISGLTEGVDKKAWLVARRNLLDKFRMMSEYEGRDDLFDCHPLIREYFGRQLQENQGEVWRQAHTVLYEYYKGLPEKLWSKYLPDTLEEMQPLFRAVNHGVKKAFNIQETLHDIYYVRIKREEKHYLTKELGAASEDLSLLSSFFTEPWTCLVEGLDSDAEYALQNWVGLRLRGAGRLEEAIELLTPNISSFISDSVPIQGAKSLLNMSELHISCGNLIEAEKYVAKIRENYDLAEPAISEMFLSTYSKILFQKGHAKKSESRLKKAEKKQRKFTKEHPFLYSLHGIQYCEILLEKNRANDALKRLKKIYRYSKGKQSIMDMAFCGTTIGKVYMKQNNLSKSLAWLEKSMLLSFRVGDVGTVSFCLLCYSAIFRQTLNYQKAVSLLQDTYEMAEPSGMRLHLTDYHLEMARLILAVEADPTQYPEATSEREQRILPFANQEEPGILTLQGHIAEVGRLINETGYHRRDAELAELKQQAGMS